jgi:hypothetical protein
MLVEGCIVTVGWEYSKRSSDNEDEYLGRKQEHFIKIEIPLPGG